MFMFKINKELAVVLVSIATLFFGMVPTTQAQEKDRQLDKVETQTWSNEKRSSDNRITQEPSAGDVNALPLATPPVTSTVTSFNGGWVNTDIVDPDYPNAAEAKSIRRKVGLYVGKFPETIADNQPVTSADIGQFLNNYHKYLKEEELEPLH